MIQRLYKTEKQYLSKKKAVTCDICHRCLSKNIYKENEIYYCLDCYKYGEVSSKQHIYSYKREITTTDHVLKLNYHLTDLQNKGSQFLIDNFNSKTNCFLQAVCGAGKTEMTYRVILNALNNHLSVAFVIPRVEVLKELYIRFKDSFPHTNIAILYQGNKTISDENLILSTPQQLISFYKEFDLLILDEADSFPYNNNPFLERLVKKSIKDDGLLFYMSATKTEALDLSNFNQFLIPARYHLKPMIVPEFKRIENLNNLLKVLKDKLNHKLILFVPSIEFGKKLTKQLVTKNYPARFISSQTVYKNHLIKQFVNDEYHILVSTTILERGVTFKKINVYVIDACHRVFNKETLIQIAGRVGRDMLNPDGELIFYSEFVTKAMKQAKTEIIEMNKRLSLCSV